ncbi:hypothetical protein XBP1_1510005 [Xenorhabdus bovienii str. puntauvense]|uniref:Uncharacterized protein n=1 Tax=Xenorhabdus bovienii str. puntauvense TaxID=1398201 RepID=A0A077NCT1_XENBV|nr:hypothetical protein XBP1_1510005 [Xenorhabdus bovienii str. puntauvense]
MPLMLPKEIIYIFTYVSNNDLKSKSVISFSCLVSITTNPVRDIFTFPG